METKKMTLCPYCKWVQPKSEEEGIWIEVICGRCSQTFVEDSNFINEETKEDELGN
jgi:ribosomal protein L37AE/L43A